LSKTGLPLARIHYWDLPADMYSLISDLASGILDRQLTPRLSLFQPTHRRHPENRQDPIRFRNLVSRLETSLSSRC
jgi:hypothetical protein